MMHLLQTVAKFKGRFFSAPEALVARLQGIKAFVFDWDGVFNGGVKDEHGSSPFNEIDSMGTNLLRFNYYLRGNTQAVTAIISGENNKAAITLANREHFDAVYCGIKHKAVALEHFCESHGIRDSEVAYMFDDVLDFSIAARCGLRIMVLRACNPLMIQWAEEKGYIDYLTAADGANYAVREMVELLTGISGRYEETMSERAEFTERYQQYLAQRNKATTRLFTVRDAIITTL